MRALMTSNVTVTHCCTALRVMFACVTEVCRDMYVCSAPASRRAARKMTPPSRMTCIQSS